MELFEIKKTIRELIMAQDPNIVTILGDELLMDRGFGSLKIIELVMSIEEYYGFEFEDDKLSYQTLRNIDSISEYVISRINEMEI